MKSTPLKSASLWKCATQMTEATTMLATGASVIGCGLGYAVASLLKVYPQKKLVPAAIGLLLAQMVGIKLIANGDLTPSNRRSAAAMEAWMRRLDAFVYTGADGSGGAGVLLTPLAIVTGATSGLGEQSAENLAACGWKVVIACRDMVAAEKARVGIISRAQQRLTKRYWRVTDDAQKARVLQLLAVVSVNVTVSKLDTNDYDSIRAFASEVGEIETQAGTEVEVQVKAGSVPSIKVRHDGLRLLLNNAGVFLRSYRQWSSLGVQTMFNINYAGPAYLTHLIMRDVIAPRLKRQTDEAHTATSVTPFRTVNLGSCANLWALGSLEPKTHEEAVSMMRDILRAVSDPTQTTRNNSLVKGMGATYGISKLGMIALAHNSAEEAKANGSDRHITAFAAHPGGVRTPIFRHIKGINRFLFSIFSPIVFKVTKYGASNQTYLSLVLIDEQKGSDVLTRAVVAASGNAETPAGVLGREVIVSAKESSGSFLIDAGVAKTGGAVSCVTNSDIFNEFKLWTDEFISKADKEAKH